MGLKALRPRGYRHYFQISPLGFAMKPSQDKFSLAFWCLRTILKLARGEETLDGRDWPLSTFAMVQRNV
jgi:hypothetical protein